MDRIAPDASETGGPLPEFAQRAEQRRQAGDADAAERILRAGLAEQPSADAVLMLARLLLEQGRGNEALDAIEQYASQTRRPGDDAPAPPPPPGSDADAPVVFAEALSDDELELAFEDAQPESERMVDADSIAQQAIRQTDTDLSGDFGSPEVSYATETVAGLLETQGDVSTASRLRRAVAASASRAPDRDRRAATIRELERWLGNLRGGMHP